MIRLECTTGGHNKFYEFHFMRGTGRFTVKGLFGAIGHAPQEAVIYDGDSEEEASREMRRKLFEKRKKGYVQVGDREAVPPLPEQNTNDLPVVWPMNAQGVKNEAQFQQLMDDPRYLCQEKLDGMRAIVHVTAEGVRIFSRSAGVNDPTRPLEKTSSLPHLAQLTFPRLTGTILDAEILADGWNSAELAGSVHRKNGSNGLVKIHVFDVLSFCGTTLTSVTLSRRLLWLLSIRNHVESEHLKILRWETEPHTKKALFKEVKQRGGEGVMFKRLNGIYLEGGRPSDNWYKAKKSATFDCIIMGFTKGQGKFNTRIGAVVFGQYVKSGSSWTLQEIGQASGMTDEERRRMSEHPSEYIGKVVVIKGQERLKSGAIRHPQFQCLRSDKDAKECRWYESEQ